MRATGPVNGRVRPAVTRRCGAFRRLLALPAQPGPVKELITIIETVIPSGMWGSHDGATLARAPVSNPIAVSAIGSVGLLLLASTVSVPAPVVGGLIVASVLVIGPDAGLGGAAGVLVHDLFYGAVGFWTASLAVWLVGFGWLVAWLVPPPSPGSSGDRSRGRVRWLPRFLLAVTAAGLLATALGAWVALAVGGQRFYVAATGLLVGLPVAVGGATVVAHLGLSPGNSIIATDQDVSPPSVGIADIALRPSSRARPSGAVVLGLLLVGLGWIGGAGVLDLVGHDLAIFWTEHELRRYAASTFGGGSSIAVIATATMAAVYRYGAVVVLLSGPLVAGAVWTIASRGPPRDGEAG